MLKIKIVKVGIVERCWELENVIKGYSRSSQDVYLCSQ
jgi:hypothetical protein